MNPSKFDVVSKYLHSPSRFSDESTACTSSRSRNNKIRVRKVLNHKTRGDSDKTNLIRSFKKQGEDESQASLSVLKFDDRDAEIANDSSNNAINDGMKARDHFVLSSCKIGEIFCLGEQNLLSRLGQVGPEKSSVDVGPKIWHFWDPVGLDVHEKDTQNRNVLFAFFVI